MGEKLFAGHVDNSLSIVPNYDPILRKSLGGRFDLDFVSVDLDMTVTGLTYERTEGEAATHNDYADLRAACSNPVSVEFVYGEILPGKIVLTGSAKLSDYQEKAGSGKICGNWSCRLRSVRGTVQEEVVPPATQDVLYGLLYNWYAATDARNIANTGWHLPTGLEDYTLRQYLSADPNFTVAEQIRSNKIREVGTTYWPDPNTGATNEVRFNARGSGCRVNGLFSALKGLFIMFHYVYDGTDCRVQHTSITTFGYSTTPSYSSDGACIRLVKDTTTLTHGQTGTYVGNDGKVYRTICIGTQEWLADNLCETKFRNGEDIPEVTGNAAWAALTTAGMCAYNNDWSNV